MSDIKKGALGEILRASKIITGDDVIAALNEQKRSGRRFGEALVNLGIVTQEDIDWALSNQLDIPYIHLKRDMIDPAAIALVPAFLARTYNCIPLIYAGGELNIAMADPLNRSAVEAIEHESGCSVNISVALLREIREMIDNFYGCIRHDSMGFDSARCPEGTLETINEDLSGSALLDFLLDFIMQNRLTSLSLQPLGDVVLIRGKQSGTSTTIGTLAPTHYSEFSHHMRRVSSILQSDNISSIGILFFPHRSGNVAFHIGIIQGVCGDYITIRLQIDTHIPSHFTDLNLSSAQESDFAKMARAEHGVTFFATNNARERECIMDLMLEEIDTAGKNVIILGDGPGRKQKRFPQIPLPELAMERTRLISDILDHDPDVLVIADATEGPVFTAACRAAMRGKLVLAGLDIQGTRNVLQQIHFYQQRNCILPIFVNGVVSVASIQLLCPSCRVDYIPSPNQLTAMRLEQPLPDFFRADGCDICGYRGFSESCILVDVLLFDDRFLRMYEQSTAIDTLDSHFCQSRLHGIDDAVLELLKQGKISPDEFIASNIF